MDCLLEHQWNGCKCEKCGIVRNEGHDWDLCEGICKRCGATQFEQHDWNGLKCTRCGKTRAISSPKNLVVAKVRLIEGEIKCDDKVIVNTIASLVRYATDNEFILSPAFAELHRKYASLSGIDHIIFDSRNSPSNDILSWITSQTGEDKKQVKSLAWSRWFEMNGTKYIRDGVRIGFNIVSYFYIP